MPKVSSARSSNGSANGSASTNGQPGKAIKRTGGGKFNPADKHIYFIASNPNTFNGVVDCVRNILIAVNEVESSQAFETFERLLARPEITLFLDSGVFSLAMQYAERHKVSHDVALRMPLAEIDGFTELRQRYIDIVKRYEDRLWGYVEIDLGGRDQKRKTRAELEALGLRPIPVYHPLNDGWDYFDELASQYDRICVGNIVKASRYVRQRILATIWKRKQAYPHLWVHLLGMTPNEWVNAFPVESLDSSTWLACVRWPQAWRERATMRRLGGFGRGFVYKMGDIVTWEKAKNLAAAQAFLNTKNWRNYVDSLHQ